MTEVTVKYSREQEVSYDGSTERSDRVNKSEYEPNTSNNYISSMAEY